MAEAELVELVACREQQPQGAQAKPWWKDIAYGSAAGIVSKLFEHPFDLVKVRLQSQPLDQPLKFKGPWDCMVKTFQKEGLSGLWRGVSMPVGGAMAENATLFVVYNQTQALLRRLDPPSSAQLARSSDGQTPPINLTHLGIAAALAGSCASFVLTPVELVKCKMQVQGSIAEAAALSAPTSISKPAGKIAPQPGPVEITRQILKTDGFKGLWLGQLGTFLRETGGGAAWFMTFELLSRAFVQRRINKGQTHSNKDPSQPLSKGDLSAVELMSSGAAAGVVYNVVLFPADCIKSTIQTEDELRGVGQRRSFMQVGKDIYRARGIKGLYQGCGLTALRAAPSSALIFYIYSRLESMFG
ncbi:mitochondrial ornithine carrier protein [Microbotryomycetes sp. JL201]|nr:mitochondrial ornithine carrier protein [Microbotryomycetes sp. JL201]